MSIDRHILFYSRSRFHRNLFKYLRINSRRVLSIQKGLHVPSLFAEICRKSTSLWRTKYDQRFYPFKDGIKLFFVNILLIALLSGCSTNSMSSTPASSAEIASTPIPATSTAVTPSTTPSVSTAVDKRNVSPARVSSVPVVLSIPDIDLSTTVVEMGWIVTEVAGERTTRWAVPYSEAGWHVNSAGVGTNGNVVISGHQVVGEAIFAQLALGEIEIGQEILVTDIRGEVFEYNVVEIADPIPLAGATEAEQALSASYIAPSSTAKLTLMTGWPDFATTHYLFVVADYVGVAQ